jgi:hypothetical protein
MTVSGPGANEPAAPEAHPCRCRTSRLAMHYPYLEYCITRVPERVEGVMTGVLPSRKLGACASGAHGADTNPSRASHTRARRLECGSHAAAPAVLTIRCVAYRYPSWSRRSWMCSFRSSSRSSMHAIPVRRRLCCKRFVLRTSGHSQHLPTVEGMPPRRPEACATGSHHGGRVQSGLTQRDMWVMHSPAGAGDATDWLPGRYRLSQSRPRRVDEQVVLRNMYQFVS